MRINELVAANVHGIADAAGDQPDWVELALPYDAAGPVSLAGWRLGDGGSGWALPDVTLAPGDALVVFASGEDRVDAELHADFSLEATGDEVRLAMPDGCVADRVATPRLYADVAYGRDATGAWAYFLEPTPGARNSTESRPGFAAPPVLSPAPGFYAQPVVVSVSAPDADAVTYTLDGRAPDEANTPASAPIHLDATAQPVVVRARAWQAGLWPSRIATGTYSQDPGILDGGVMVMSITVDPPDLWDDETGIYVYGTDYEPWYPYFGANFWESWEKDAHVEIFGTDGASRIDQDAGIEIAGGYSRAFDQRNFELLARSGYGPDGFDYPLFHQESIESYKHLYLRNGGDWCGTSIVDASVSALFRDETGARYDTIDAQAYEPVVVYLNGQYWGLYELKERLDEYWIADHRGEGPDDLDRVRLGWTHTPHWTSDEGDWAAFDALEELVASRDLADPDAYADFAARVDTRNFASAVVVQGWIGNSDWWQNNLRMWRPRRDDGRWRWMVYDFGHGWPDYDYDHLATSVSGNWRGLPIGAALANEGFRNLFVNAHADYLNTSLRGDRARATVAGIADAVRPVMPAQRARWCGGASMADWESAVSYAETYAELRGPAIDASLVTHLGLGGHAALSLTAEPADAGSFRLAVVTVPSPFAGTYYQGVPVDVTALPASGWVFDRWSDASLPSEAAVTLPMRADTSLTAVFRPE